MKPFIKRFLSFLFTVAIIVGLFIAWFNRQDIYDWYVLRNYDPPTEIVELADEITLTNKGRKIFYVSKPLVVNATEFNAACRPESTIVLGCFISNKGVYLYDIDDERLSGVKQVTAAHEMLHVAYERLGQDERIAIDAMTMNAYESLNNERIKNTVNEYRARDTSIVPNELHSILATEVGDLPQDLDEYYSQYFKNRLKIVDFSDRYEAEFENRRTRVDNLDDKLGRLKLEIEASKNDLSLQYDALKSQRASLDELLNQDKRIQYNNNIPAFNQQVSNYNRSVNLLDDKINTYNELVKQRNAIAVEVQGLVESIDSRPQNF